MLQEEKCFHSVEINEATNVFIMKIFCISNLHQSLSSISMLRIWNTKLTQISVENLSRLIYTIPSLKLVELGQESIDDETLNVLCKEVRVRQDSSRFELCLDHNSKITSKSSESLAKLVSKSCISELSLVKTSITSDGWSPLLSAVLNTKDVTLKIDSKHKEACCEFKDYEKVKNKLSFIE